MAGCRSQLRKTGGYSGCQENRGPTHDDVTSSGGSTSAGHEN